MYRGDVEGDSELRELVEGARRGDERAWEQLFRRCYPGMLFFARRRTYNAEMAMDAVSETFGRAVAGIGRFEWQGGGFDGWIYGILRHVLLDDQRKAFRRASRPLPIHAPIETEVTDALVSEAEAEQVQVAFMRLDPEEQELLELRVVSGLSAAEVAVVLGKKAGAVRMAQSRALAHLRALLESGDHD